MAAEASHELRTLLANLGAAAEGLRAACADDGTPRAHRILKQPLRRRGLPMGYSDRGIRGLLSEYLRTEQHRTHLAAVRVLEGL